MPTVERYTPLQTMDYSERQQPAERYQGSPNELFEQGYLLIGFMDYTINVQTCYDDYTCENHSDENDISTSLLTLAAERGADKLIELSTKLELVPTTKSICTYFNTTTYTDKDGNTHTMTICASYKNYSGHRESWQRRALFFRHEPNKDNAEKNYVAVRKAMESMQETTDQASDGATEGPANDLQSDLKKAETPIDDYDAQLIAAIDAGNVDFLQKQLQSDALKDWEKKNQVNPLIIAYARNAQAAYQYLETQTHQWNTETETKFNAFHAAVAFAGTESLQALEKNHPYLIRNDKVFKEKLFRSIAMARDANVIPFLVPRFFDLNTKLGEEQCTILHHAVLFENLPVVEALVKSGASVESRCKDGSTPILLASTLSTPDILRFLISAHANLLATDSNGNTAVHYAAIKSSRETLNYLLTQPRLSVVQNNVKDVDACVVAVGQKNWDAVAPLIGKGATCNFPNEEQSIAATGLLMREGSADALKAYLKLSNTFDYPLGKKAELFGGYCAEVCSEAKMDALLNLGLSLRRDYNGRALFKIAREKNNEGAAVAILRRTYQDPKKLSDDDMLKHAIISGDNSLVSMIRHAQGHAF